MAQAAVMTGDRRLPGRVVRVRTDPTAPTLVVYDTGAGREVVHQPMPFCATVFGCNLDAVIGRHVYFTRTSYNGPSRSSNSATT